MTIENNNLFSESYNLVKNFINTNITDPKKRFKKNWVHNSLPDITSKGFDGYPFFVVQENISEDKKSFDRSTSQKIFRATITIYAEDSAQIDVISDELFDKMKSRDIQDNLNEFKSIELSSSLFDYIVINGRKILRRVFAVRCLKRIGKWKTNTISGTYTVSGTLSHDATGVYVEDGVFGGKMSYARSGGFFIWWSGNAWVISQAKGFAFTPLWNRFNTNITGDYNPGFGTTGVATVSRLNLK